MKLSFKRLLAKFKSWDDDLIPSMFASVDIFDAMYMTKCMQSAGTLTVGSGIIIVDLVQNLIAIRRLTKRTRLLHHDLKNHQLLPYVFIQLKKSRRLDSDFLRFGSNLSRFALSSHSHDELRRLESLQARVTNANAKAVIGPVRIAFAHQIHPFNAVQPESTQPSRIAKEAMHYLHACEEVAVVEYNEAIVPFVYAIYLAVMMYLPNALYYEDLKSIMKHKQVPSVMTNILIYAMLELLSLVYVHYMIKRCFNMLVFYQLAFALEKEWRIYQSCFVGWMLMAFQYLLVHNGTSGLMSTANDKREDDYFSNIAFLDNLFLWMQMQVPITRSSLQAR